MSGNEKSDELAKLATTQKPPTFFHTSLSYLKRVVRAKMVMEWKEWWDSIPQEGTEYLGGFRLKPDMVLETDNRVLVSTVTQLRTGYGYFNGYLSKILIPDGNYINR